MLKYLTQPELQKLAAEYVLVLKKVFPRITLEFFDHPTSVRLFSRLNTYLSEFGIRRWAPRYFDYMLKSTSYSDWDVLLRKISRKDSVYSFRRQVEVLE